MFADARLAAAGLILSALVAGCTPADNEKSAQALAAPVVASSPDVHPFKIGALQAWALKDGEIVIPVGSTDLPWSDAAAVSAALTGAGLPTDAVHLSIQPLLIRDGDRLVLIDSGAGGAMGTQNRLPASLAAAGINPATITDVLISHAHGDHVGGLANAQGQLAFPNATIRMSQEEWAFAQAGAEAAGAGVLLAAITPRVQPFQPGAQITPEIKAVQLAGHTPGHSGYEITSDGQTLLYVGDSLHSSAISVARPDITNAWDSDKPAGITTRQGLLERSAGQNLRLHAGHFPYPGLGRIQKRGDAYVWVPES